MDSLTIIKPDDWHLHLRDGDFLKSVVNHTARVFKRAIIMPNLKPPVVTVQQANDYYQRIMEAVQPQYEFQPLMTLYLTSSTTKNEIRLASESEHVHAIKLYPAGATTNSAAGLQQITDAYPLFSEMEKNSLPLLIHGEVTHNDVDIFDREAVFIDEILTPITQQFPALKIVFEHITSKTAVDFVLETPANVAATITAHHLLANRNDMLVGGIKPHYYCLPVLKQESDRITLLNAATSGNPKFFLGTDSAPHPQSEKESACGCAGSYTAAQAIELYATAFESVNKLDQLEQFASINGAKFYGLPVNTEKITLSKKEQQIPELYPFANQNVVPFWAGKKIQWSS
ncbi:MAG: dihydroorotase [Calditrichaeota bacterium]|nr:dihydroorotase [Calditrichota bacterium]